MVVRSTVPPGTLEEVITPIILGHSQRNIDDIGLMTVPEFLREGTAVADYYDPPLLIAGTWNRQANGFQNEVASLLATEPDRIDWVQCREAEMMKALCNVFHAMKVTFANEVGAALPRSGDRRPQRDAAVGQGPQAQYFPGLPAAGHALRRVVPAQGPGRHDRPGRGALRGRAAVAGHLPRATRPPSGGP